MGFESARMMPEHRKDVSKPSHRQRSDESSTRPLLRLVTHSLPISWSWTHQTIRILRTPPSSQPFPPERHITHALALARAPPLPPSARFQRRHQTARCTCARLRPLTLILFLDSEPVSDRMQESMPNTSNGRDRSRCRTHLMPGCIHRTYAMLIPNEQPRTEYGPHLDGRLVSSRLVPSPPSTKLHLTADNHNRLPIEPITSCRRRPWP